MKKIKLEVIGLSFSQTQSGAYALILGEVDGNRRLPIVIGPAEAQAIAISLEKLIPKRPLTHELFKTVTEAFNITIEEIVICNLLDGVFYSKLICKAGRKKAEIDSRTSDAVALAVKVNCPIFTYEEILEVAGISVENEEEIPLPPIPPNAPPKPDTTTPRPLLSYTNRDEFSQLTDMELKKLLDYSLKAEEYERAARLRDEINKRNLHTGNQQKED